MWTKRSLWKVILLALLPLCVVTFSEAQPVTPAELQQFADLQRDLNFLLYRDGIEGTALRIEDGEPVLIVYVNRNFRGEPNVPQFFDFRTTPSRRVAIRQERIAEFTALAGARMGTSTSNSGGCYAGTLGIAVKNAAGVQGYLTNAHIAAAEARRLCPNGEVTEQVAPGTLDVMCGNSTRIGTLVNAIDIPSDGVTHGKVDAAFVREIAGAVDPHNACGICPADLSTVSPVDAATSKLKVRTCGRGNTTATKGQVEEIFATVWVRFRCGLRAIFENQIVVLDEPSPAPRFSRPGYSGAVAYGETAKVVGLIFAGDGISRTLLNPMDAVLAELKVEIDTARHCR